MRKLLLQEWAAQISERGQSGLSVDEWCEKNGVSKATYYYRHKRVREELLEAMETGSSLQISGATDCMEARTRGQSEKPVFAALPMPQRKGAAVTVWIGGYSVDIQNGADNTVVEQVLKVVSRL